MAESALAKSLAGNDKKTRDNGFKKLKKYILSRANSSQRTFQSEDMLKLWKGLHYSMWMCDKPIVQEELADKFVNLYSLIKNEDQAFLFFECYIETQCREWLGIDRWRMDKFMMLFRKVLRSALEFLRCGDWIDARICRFISIIKDKVLLAGDSCPNGIKLHVSDILLEELATVGGFSLSEEQTLQFLEPFCELVATSKEKTLVQYICNQVFDEISYQAFPDTENEEEVPEIPSDSDDAESSGNVNQNDEESNGEAENPDDKGLKFNYKTIADRLFEFASSDECLQRNRKLLYSQVKKLRDVASGVDPYQIDDVDSDDADPITEAKVKKAAEKLTKFNKLLVNPSSEQKPSKEKKGKGKEVQQDVAMKGKESRINKRQEKKSTSSNKDTTKANKKSIKLNGVPEQPSATDSEPNDRSSKKKRLDDEEKDAVTIDHSKLTRTEGDTNKSGEKKASARKRKKIKKRKEKQQNEPPHEHEKENLSAFQTFKGKRKIASPESTTQPKKLKRMEKMEKSEKQGVHQGFNVTTLAKSTKSQSKSKSCGKNFTVQKISPSGAEVAGIHFEPVKDESVPLFFRKAMSKIRSPANEEVTKSPSAVPKASKAAIKTPKSAGRRVSFGLHRNLIQEFRKQESIGASPVPSPLTRPAQSILKHNLVKFSTPLAVKKKKTRMSIA